MKKFVWVLLLVLLVVGYLFRTELVQLSTTYLSFSPCDTPISYSFGTIDPRFGISSDTFMQDTSEAASIWSSAEGKPLFHYDPTSPFTISLIYDQRQSLNTQINQLNTQLNSQKEAITPQLSEYNQKVAAFKQQITDLNKQISDWNAKGGAPEEVFTKLKQQQAVLQQEQKQLETIASQLNQSTDSYNNQVSSLNQDVSSFNQTLSVKPEEGLYTQNGTARTIEIYINNSKPELVHTLSHELGHALGIGHNDSISSIMYPQTNQIVTPSLQDLAALQTVCQKVSLVKLVQDKVTSLLKQYKIAIR